MAQPHLLPLVVQVHLVGEADLHVVGQRLAAASARAVSGCGQAGDQSSLAVARLRASAPRSMSTVPSQSTAASSTQADALRLLGREARLDDLVAQHRQVGPAPAAARRRWASASPKAPSDLPSQQVVVQRAQGLALQRLGMRRQQLAEEGLARRLGPADQVHALVQVLHQRAAAASGRSCAARGEPLGCTLMHQLAAGVAQPLHASRCRAPSSRAARISAWLHTWLRKSRR